MSYVAIKDFQLGFVNLAFRKAISSSENRILKNPSSRNDNMEFIALKVRISAGFYCQIIKFQKMPPIGKTKTSPPC